MLEMVLVFRMNVAAAGAGARQWMARPDLRRKNYRRAITVMHVTIHRHCPRKFPFLVHALDRHGHIVNHAETFAMIRKRRSEEHTSELQSHSFISYAVFCLKT